ncbi:hypothetical protein [Nakamurella deserti]|uniref:hypothetical protein n=1 Tax=Nakamurella deserti TaxID=2164074 RepID=UPI000DBE304F|nr:hypothetical protein [Nakamurella deserti]
MTTRMADRPLDQRRAIHLDTVELVNIHGAAAVTPDLLHDRLGRHSPGVAFPVTSVDEVYSSVIQELAGLHFERVAATVARRRSLTDSLQIALSAHWDAVVDHRDEHRAVRSIQARRLDTAAERGWTAGRGGPSIPTAGGGDTGPATPGDMASWAPAAGIATWLDLIADAHHIRWELPREQLALLVAATLEGLTIGYLATGDAGPARAVLRVLGYQVARYGRRPAKNQQH